MAVDVERAMSDYGEIGYSGFEIPILAGSDPILVFYNPTLLCDDYVMDVMDAMPNVLGETPCGSLSFCDGIAQVEAYEFPFQGEDARYVEVGIQGSNGRECVLLCIAPMNDEAPSLSYADTYDVARAELAEMGIISVLA